MVKELVGLIISLNNQVRYFNNRLQTEMELKCNTMEILQFYFKKLRELKNKQ